MYTFFENNNSKYLTAQVTVQGFMVQDQKAMRIGHFEGNEAGQKTREFLEKFNVSCFRNCNNFCRSTGFIPIFFKKL